MRQLLLHNSMTLPLKYPLQHCKPYLGSPLYLSFTSGCVSMCAVETRRQKSLSIMKLVSSYPSWGLTTVVADWMYSTKILIYLCTRDRLTCLQPRRVRGIRYALPYSLNWRWSMIKESSSLHNKSFNTQHTWEELTFVYTFLALEYFVLNYKVVKKRRMNKREGSFS